MRNKRKSFNGGLINNSVYFNHFGVVSVIVVLLSYESYFSFLQVKILPVL